MANSRPRWRRAALWVLGAIVALPVAVVWAFVVYDLGSGGGPDRWLKLVFIAVLTAPVLALCAVLIVRILRNWRRDTGRLAPWLNLGAVTILGLAAVGVAGLTARVEWRQPAPPGDFYDAPELTADATRGMMLRSEPLDGAPEGSRAWRILYTSGDTDGRTVAVSGVVVVPDTDAPEQGRPVMAWAHGTVGVARNCAPSLRPNWTELIDGLDHFLERGFTVVATDYVGLGTGHTHPYLAGPVAAANVLDSVRALRDLEEAEASTRFAVWGASQGGHAALFMGAMGAVADVELVGIVAAAPPTDLKELFAANLGEPFGDVLASLAFATWPDAYDGVELGQIVSVPARPVVRNIASYCFLEEKQTLAVLPGAALLRLRFISNDPVETEPWARLFEENSPRSQDVQVPVFIAQGEADPLIRAAITRNFVEELCRQGARVEYRTYPGVGHVEIGPEAAADAAGWMVGRFEGAEAPRTCE